jgi:hypothetical protein
MRTFALALAVLAQEEPLVELRRAAAEREAGAAGLVREAHEALDRGDYEAAVARHRRAVGLKKEAAGLREREKALVEKAVAELVAKFDDESPDVRDAASAGIRAVGPAAVPHLLALKPRTAEAASRVRALLDELAGLELDAQGRIHQWATRVRASSEYTSDRWSAQQAAGKPDTPAAGDHASAWASLAEDGGEEWLELDYACPVRPAAVRIHENYNPGSVVKIEARDPEGKWGVLWEGREAADAASRWFAPVLPPASFPTRTIRITLDSAGVRGWNEIDAVELVGLP